jgi:hypothetical protein
MRIPEGPSPLQTFSPLLGKKDQKEVDFSIKEK